MTRILLYSQVRTLDPGALALACYQCTLEIISTESLLACAKAVAPMGTCAVFQDLQTQVQVPLTDENRDDLSTRMAVCMRKRLCAILGEVRDFVYCCFETLLLTVIVYCCFETRCI